MDDHKYSVGRVVVFRLDGAPGKSGRSARKASGTILQVDLADDHWLYTIERQRAKQRMQVREEDVLYGVIGRKKPERADADTEERQERVAGILGRAATDSALVDFLRTTVRDLVKREELEETERREGRDLPLAAGDYIRIRGDLRPEMEPYHNYYGKILEVMAADITTLRTSPQHDQPQTYAVTKKYLAIMDEGSQVEIYDPEIKLFYTANGRSTILNWRAATFLAEAFGDDPPYRLEFSYLEDHIFTRDELKDMTTEQLAQLLASILYVKGHMGWRDLQQPDELARLSQPYLLDSVLAASRFDQRRNRAMTPAEIEEKRKQVDDLRRLLGR
jgi:hypothetical protein